MWNEKMKAEMAGVEGTKIDPNKLAQFLQSE